MSEKDNISRSSIFREKMRIEKEKREETYTLKLNSMMPENFNMYERKRLRDLEKSILEEDIGKEPGE